MTRASGAPTGGSGTGIGTASTGGSSSGSGSLADSGRSTKGRSTANKSAPRDARSSVGVGEANLCTFVVNGQRFALSTALVRELVEVTAVTLVPRVDPAILGLFNLRGEPMPLVDMATVLGMGDSVGPLSKKMAVMILRSETLSVGARIDALGTVVPNRGLVASTDPNAMLLGFLEAAGTDGHVAVINPADLLARLERLKQSASERE